MGHSKVCNSRIHGVFESVAEKFFKKSTIIQLDLFIPNPNT